VKNKAPAYLWYPKDYLADANTVLMSLEEEGCYRRLLDYCWLEGSVPNDMVQLGRMCKGLDSEKMSVIWKSLEPCFRLKNGRWHHPRLDKERKKQEANRLAKSRAGKKGADARYNKGKNGSANVLPVANSSLTITNTNTTTKKTTYTAEFEEIWSIHNRGPKKKAQEEYKKAIKEKRTNHQELKNALQLYVQNTDEIFRGVHLFRFIRDDRWDEVEKPSGINKRTILVGGKIVKQ
tara:strand:- start:762 stop:1466 length:705 start_codon:yes stop_codon:yes gene_type:complete